MFLVLRCFHCESKLKVFDNQNFPELCWYCWVFRHKFLKIITVINFAAVRFWSLRVNWCYRKYAPSAFHMIIAIHLLFIIVASIEVVSFLFQFTECWSSGREKSWCFETMFSVCSVLKTHSSHILFALNLLNKNIKNLEKYKYFIKLL